MLKYSKIPLTIVIDEAFSDMQMDSEERDMAMLKRWATDLYREFSVAGNLKHKIVLLQTNHLGAAELPEDFKLIDQVSFRLKKDKKDCTPKEKVVQWIQKAYDGCEVEINFNCDVCHKSECSCPIPKVAVDIDYAWMKSNPWYTHQTTMGVVKNSNEELTKNQSYLTDKFTLLAYKGNSYFRLRYHVDSCENLSCIGCKYGYSIERNTILTDLPPNTELLVSYLGEETDENGDVLIPDQPDCLDAVKKGILSKFFAIRFLQTSDSKYRYFHEKFQQESDISIGRAKSRLDTPSSQEFRKFMSSVWFKRIRNHSAVNNVIPKDGYDYHLV
jgi:hypothetical protein